MKRLLAACVMLLALVGLNSEATLAQSTTTTLTVTIPDRPLQAVVLSPCALVVTTSSQSVTCSVTIGVVDPTGHNAGWRVSFKAVNISCSCGGTLSPIALNATSLSGVVVLSGQHTDAEGGPRLLTSAVGQSLSDPIPVLVAQPGYGNGAYSITVGLRWTYPSDATPGTYVPSLLASAVPD